MTVLTVADPSAMHQLGERLGRLLRAGDLVILSGPLGAGKTTLTRGIGEGLGVRGPITSPTFVLARTHPSLIEGPPLVHVDAYRLGSALEVDDLDIDFARSVVIAEWGTGYLDGIVDSMLELSIERPVGSGLEIEGDEPVEPRVVTVSASGPRWQQIDWTTLGGA